MHTEGSSSICGTSKPTKSPSIKIHNQSPAEAGPIRSASAMTVRPDVSRFAVSFSKPPILIGHESNSNCRLFYAIEIARCRLFEAPIPAQDLSPRIERLSRILKDLRSHLRPVKFL